MLRVLALFVRLFGVVCCAIAAAHIVLGPTAIIGSIPVNAALDSEDRFFAALFLGFGFALIWCSLDLPGRRGVFGALLLTFGVGGVARLVSVLAVGWPHPFHILLTGVELMLPLTLWAWLRIASLTVRPGEGVGR